MTLGTSAQHVAIEKRACCTMEALQRLIAAKDWSENQPRRQMVLQLHQSSAINHLYSDRKKDPAGCN